MPRRHVSVLPLLLAGLFAGPAHADSTVTQTVPPGGTMRSSADVVPTPENPVLVTITTAPSSQSGCNTNCSQGDAQITVATKADHDYANGPSNEGPSGYAFAGPQIDITSSAPAFFSNLASVVYEIDRSVVLPGFTTRGIGGSDTQFFVRIAQPGRPLTGDGTEYLEFAAVEKLADGDFRLTITREAAMQSSGRSAYPAFGSHDLLQQSFYALAFGQGELPDALRNGVAVSLKTNYRAHVRWKITVSKAVANQLKLASTVIGAKSFAKPGGGNRRIPLIRAARRALKRYSRVSVTATSVATGPNGQVIRDKHTFTLDKPESELG